MKKTILLIVLICLRYEGSSQTLPAYVPGNSLLAWYPFTGNAADSSGNGYDGTVTAATLTADRHGSTNSAYLFDGASSYINTLLMPPTAMGARTITTWFKYNSLPTTCGSIRGMAIAGYGGNTSSCSQAGANFSVEVDYTDGPVLTRVDGICKLNQAYGDTMDNGWHFLAAVYDPSWGDFDDIKLYVDGEYKTSTTISYSGGTSFSTGSFTSFCIGKGHYSCARFFSGKIDDIGVWSRALRESELLALYLGQPTATADSFHAYATDNCTDVLFKVLLKHQSSAVSVRTYFGDGAWQTDPIPVSGISLVNHTYASEGLYPVKHVVYNSSIAIDSVTYTYDYQFCRTLPIAFYNDSNFNCTYDTATEALIYAPSLVRVDSAGVTIDTIPATSGLFYRAYGPVGTLYTFKLIETAPGLYASCPATGILTHTVSVGSVPAKSFALSCSATPGYDLKLFTSFRAGPHRFAGMIAASNTYCTPPAAVIKMQLNPKYNSSLTFYPTPTSIVGNVVSWNVNSLSSVVPLPFLIYAGMEGGAAIGDTLMTVYNIDPTIGDTYTADNMIIRIDTVKAGYDPNDIAMSPAGCLDPGVTELTYTVRFENTGNDTAFNIYVLDTLSGYYVPNSLKILTASAVMNTTVTKLPAYTVVKFDFPNINLPDSGRSDLCHGMVVYSVKIREGLAGGTEVTNRAGIYFDTNPVVLTNTVSNRIMCPTGVTQHNLQMDVHIQPNPTMGDVQVETKNADNDYIVTNSVGQVLMNGTISGTLSKISLRELPAGIYYLTLRNIKGTTVHKLVKM